MTPTFQSPKLAPLIFLIFCLVWLNVHAEPAAAQSTSAQQANTTNWVSPLPAGNAPVKEYKGQLTRFGPGHRGVDYRVKEGQSLVSPSAGVLAFNSPVALIPAVSIQHANGYRTTFEPACSKLPVGTPLLAGQPFGTVCKPTLPIPVKNPVVTGVKLVLKYLNPMSHCRPKLCLHFSVRHRGNYLSPLALIDGMQPSRLLR